MKYAAIIVLLAVSTASSASAQYLDIKTTDPVVAITKTEKNPKDVPVSMTVVTADEIKKSGAATVAEAVRLAAHTAVIEYGGAGAGKTLSIRGASFSEVLILLDGIRINSARDSGVDLSSIPVTIDDIERIEIIRGGASALYGPDAVGGVVNIVTKKAKGNFSRIGGTVGSHGFDQLQLGAHGKQGAASYTITGSRETSDGSRENSDLMQWIVNGRVGYELAEGSSIDFTASYLSKELGVPGSTFSPSYEARMLDRILVTGFSYKQRLAKELEARLSAFQNDDRLQFKDPDNLLVPLSIHKSTTKGGEAQINYYAGSWSLFTLGYERREDSLDSTDTGSHSATLDAAYFQDEINLGKSLMIVAGIRQDKHSLYGDRMSPKMSGRYIMAGSGTIIRASAGKSFHLPTFNDLFWPNQIYAVGNPNLRPETAKEYEASIEQPFGTGNVIKVTWFKRKVNDLIEWRSDPYTSVLSPVNIGRADIEGIESEAALRFSDAAELKTSYSYIKPLDMANKEKIYSAAIPKNQAKGVVTIALDTDVYLTTEARMVENYVRTDEPKWRYVVMDAKIAQRIGKAADKGEIYFGMTNIFDRKYEVVKGYPMPPKEIRGGITYFF